MLNITYFYSKELICTVTFLLKRPYIFHNEIEIKNHHLLKGLALSLYCEVENFA